MKYIFAFLILCSLSLANSRIEKEEEKAREWGAQVSQIHSLYEEKKVKQKIVKDIKRIMPESNVKIQSKAELIKDLTLGVKL